MNKKTIYHFMDVAFTLEYFEEDWHIRIGNTLLNGPGYPDKETAKKLAQEYIQETYTKEYKNV